MDSSIRRGWFLGATVLAVLLMAVVVAQMDPISVTVGTPAALTGVEAAGEPRTPGGDAVDRSTTSTRLTVLETDDTPLGGPATLASRSTSSRGTVIEVKGVGVGPLAGVLIAMRSPSGERKVIGRTDADGRAFVSRQALRVERHGLHFVEGSLAGWASGRVPLTSSLHRAELFLVPGAGLDILAVDTTGAPVPGAHLNRRGRIAQSQPTVSLQSVDSDETGRIRVRDLEPGVHEFRLMAPGYVPRDFRAVATSSEIRDYVVSVERAAVLTVTVHDDIGNPVQGAAIAVFDAGWYPGTSYSEGVTDAMGHAQFDELPFGADGVRVVGSHASHLSSEVVAPLDNHAAVNLALQRGAHLELFTIDGQGRPVPGSFSITSHASSSTRDGVSLIPQVVWTHTMGEGRSVVGPLPPGADLQASFQVSDGAMLWRDTISGLEVGELRTVRLALPRMVRLAVHVRDRNEEPLSGSLIAYQDAEVWEDGVAVTAARRFRARVDSEGNAELWVQAGALRLRFSDSQNSLVVERELDAAVDELVKLVAPPPLALEGHLLDGVGKPLSGWVLSLRDRPGAPAAVTGPDGGFRFERVDGPSDLVVEDPLVGPVIVGVRLRPGAERITARLVRARIEGRVVDSSGTGAEAFIVVSPSPTSATAHLPLHGAPSLTVAASHNGHFELDLPPGKWSIRASTAKDRKADATVNVDPLGIGEPSSLQLHLDP